MKTSSNKTKRTLQWVGIVLGGVLFLGVVIYLTWVLGFEKKYLFQQNEKKLKEAAEAYYALNDRLLPDKEGETSRVLMKTLYEEQWLEALYEPKTDKLCDTSGWVRVKKEGSEYRYFVNLICGKYKSDIDRRGPVVTLKGDEEIVLDKGNSYQEMGIQKVVDDSDGVMDIMKVEIDSSKVDTNTIGDYEVTYTVSDSFHNKTVKTRKVKVVQLLSTIVKQATNNQNYYKGEPNNYVLFNGMLFRIIGVGNDNSVQLISQDTISNVSYLDNSMKEGGNLYTWLNEYFYSHLDKTYQDMIVNHKWCQQTTDNPAQMGSDCGEEVGVYKIGLLYPYELNRAQEENRNYLKNGFYNWLFALRNEDNPWIIHPTAGYQTFEKTRYMGVRPVFYLKDDTYALKGKGTSSNPYILGGHKEGKENDLLNSRYVGEYVNYSGVLWRIAGFDKDKNIKMVLDGVVEDKTGNGVLITYQTATNTYIFDPKEKGNIGYIINQKITDYLSTKAIVTHEYSIPYTHNGQNDTSKNEKTFQAKLSIPTTTGLFSVHSDYQNTNDYFLLNASTVEKMIFRTTSFGVTFEMDIDIKADNAVKVEAYFQPSLKIASGSGLKSDPYYVK